MYFSLINKNTGKEAYTSPYYTIDNSEVIDYYKVFDVFRFYFNRINSGIKQQLESPRTPEDQKKQLKYIGPENYQIALMELTNEGGYHTKQFWIKDLIDFSDMKDYKYESE